MIVAKRHKLKSLDIWCGDPQDFVADHHTEDSTSGINLCQKKSYRHLALSEKKEFDTDEKSKENLNHLYNEWLKNDEIQHPLRITIMCQELEKYQILTTVFDTFLD